AMVDVPTTSPSTTTNSPSFFITLRIRPHLLASTHEPRQPAPNAAPRPAIPSQPTPTPARDNPRPRRAEPLRSGHPTATQHYDFAPLADCRIPRVALQSAPHG